MARLARVVVPGVAHHVMQPGNRRPTYVSNAMNQYTHVGGVECLYDHRGNTTYDGGNMYTYNAANQLITARKITGPLSAAMRWLQVAYGACLSRVQTQGSHLRIHIHTARIILKMGVAGIPSREGQCANPRQHRPFDSLRSY
jgi:hypothetical protein